MAAQQTNDSFAAQIAASIGNPTELPSYGTYVIYSNHRYLLAIRNSKYVAWDISVYADDGALLTNSTDVWLNALGDIPGEVTEDVLSTLTGIGSVVSDTAGNLGTVAKWAPFIAVGLVIMVVYVFSSNYSKRMPL